MKKVWQIKDVKGAEASKKLKSFLKNDILAHLLAQRGIKNEAEAKAFLNPKNNELISPYVFCDMLRAVERIKRAMGQNEHILIWGDFDADGISATAVLYKLFNKLGANFSHFIPNREAHGHGLNSKELVKIIAKKKLKLLITVDCGISDNTVISMLNGLKVDTIITDHHRAPEILPEAFAILNPMAAGAIKDELEISQIDSLCNLAGVGVAYKLACGLIEEFKIDDDFKNELLTFVALGTIGDVVPLLGENRNLVALGLEQINKKANKGIAMLFENLKIQNGINAQDVAFMLTPRINAVGRLGAPDEAFNFLISDSEIILGAIIQKLNHYNSIRQTLCDEVFLQCLAKINKEILKENAIILFDKDWHMGIIGIVATRLIETYGKPVFLTTVDNKGCGRCSIRGVEPYNIYEILKENENLFSGFGGHKFAGGFSFDISEGENIEDTFKKIKAEILKTINETATEGAFGDVLEIDFELQTEDEINFELIKTLSKLEPCGQLNEYPIFCLKGAKLLNFKNVGKEGKHLKFECSKENTEQILNCVWWKRGDFSIPLNSEIDIAFYPKINVFNGNTTIQLEIFDLKTEITTAGKGEIKIYDHRQKNIDSNGCELLKKIDEYLGKNPQIKVLATKFSTVESLQSYKNIFSNIIEGQNPEIIHNLNEIMLFDYPLTQSALTGFITTTSPEKIHLMQEKFEQSPLYYIESVFKMAKFAHNKKNGEVVAEKMAALLGVNVDFIEITLEFLQSINAINIISKNKIELLESSVDFKNWKIFSDSPVYEILLEELNAIFEFKKFLNSVESDYFKCN